MNEQKQQLAVNLNSLQNQEAQYRVAASISGTLDVWDIGLKVGQYVHRDQPFGIILNADKMMMYAYVPEADVENIDKDCPVRFILKWRERCGRPYHQSAHFQNRNVYPSWPDLSGRRGHSCRTSSSGHLALMETRYLVEIVPHDPTPFVSGQTGEVRFLTDEVSLLRRIGEKCYVTLVKESNF